MSTAPTVDVAALHREAAVLRQRAGEVRRQAQRLQAQHQAVRWQGPARRMFDNRLEQRLPALGRVADDLDRLADDLEGVARHAPGPVLHAPVGLQEGDGLRGTPSPAVRNLQNLLAAAGYNCGPDGADGRFGSDTKAALEAFQQAHHLPVTGVADARTMAALEAAAHAPKPKPTPAPTHPSTVAPVIPVKPVAPLPAGGLLGPVSSPDPRIPQADWNVVRQIASRYGIDPKIIAAIGIFESGWGTLGDGRPIKDGGSGNILGVGSFDSGSSTQWSGLEKQVDQGCQILSKDGVTSFADIQAGKLHNVNGVVKWASADKNPADQVPGGGYIAPYPWSRGVVSIGQGFR